MKTVLDRIVIQKMSSTETSMSGLITLSVNQLKGKVVAVGPDVDNIEVDNVVIYRGGVDVTVDGKQLIVLSLNEVLVVLDKEVAPVVSLLKQ